MKRRKRQQSPKQRNRRPENKGQLFLHPSHPRGIGIRYTLDFSSLKGSRAGHGGKWRYGGFFFLDRSVSPLRLTYTLFIRLKDSESSNQTTGAIRVINHNPERQSP